MRHTLSPEQAQFETRDNAVRALCEQFEESDTALITRAVDLYWPQRDATTELPDTLLVACQLKHLNVDAQTLVAAILMSVNEDQARQDATADNCFTDFGAPVNNLVANVRRLNRLSVSATGTGTQLSGNSNAESLRRMLLSMVTDVRALLIKLAFRTQELHVLGHFDTDYGQRIARETLEIFAPLANRLGLGHIKWEMEDLCFRSLEPQAYKRVASALEESRASRENYIRDFVEEFRLRLDQAGYQQANVFGRPKHIYSIWKKMRNKRIEFQDLFDIRAVRVLADSVSDCYAILGIAHGAWQPITREFDDYIANPKDNGYRSLHTAVIGPQGKPVEIQIRTSDMDREAELGFAAHWRYKEGGPEDANLRRQIKGLRQLLDDSDDESLVEDLTQSLKAERVYIFTPKGDVVDMQAGSTPLDFAYHVHSEIGHRCRGAKINGSIVPLTTTLTNGDQVEILTTREPSPSRDWLSKSLGYLHTSRARSKVRAWFNVQDHEQHLADGRAIVDSELRRANSSLSIDRLTQAMKFDKASELYVALARNDVTAIQLATTITRLEAPSRAPDLRQIGKRKAGPVNGADQISVQGVGSLLTQLANCCKPVPYDRIVGFITQGKGVSVHRADCSNILNLQEAQRNRLIEVEWGDEAGATYLVDLKISAYDRRGLLRDVSTVLANANADVVAVNTESDIEHQTAELKISVYVESLEALASLTDKLRQLRNVQSVRRLNQA